MEESPLASGQSPNPASRPSSGAEQTEKADAPREPPPVELKPDPTSSMAAAEAEALSESSEQGAPPPARARLPPHPRGSPLSSVSSLSSQTHPSLHLFASFTLELSSLPVPIPCSFLLLVWKHPDTVLELPAQPCLRTTHGVPCCPETSQGLGWLKMPTHICLWWHTL
jgi:hypothetical protein